MERKRWAEINGQIKISKDTEIKRYKYEDIEMER